MDTITIPDIYANGVLLGVAPFDVTLTLTVAKLDRLPGQSGQQPQAVPEICATVRMSHEQAKVLSIMLRKGLKQHEDMIQAPISVPNAVCESMGISLREDW